MTDTEWIQYPHRIRTHARTHSNQIMREREWKRKFYYFIDSEWEMGARMWKKYAWRRSRAPPNKINTQKNSQIERENCEKRRKFRGKRRKRWLRRSRTAESKLLFIYDEVCWIALALSSIVYGHLVADPTVNLGILIRNYILCARIQRQDSFARTCRHYLHARTHIIRHY